MSREGSHWVEWHYHLDRVTQLWHWSDWRIAKLFLSRLNMQHVWFWGWMAFLPWDTFANLVMPRGVLYTFPSKGAMMQLLHRIGTQLFSVIFTALDCYCSMCYWDLVLIALAELRSETQQLWFRGKTRQTLCGFCPDLVAPTNFRIGSNFWQIGCCLMCSLRGITISDLTRSLRDRRMPVWQQIIQYWGGFRSSRRTTSCTANWDN